MRLAFKTLGKALEGKEKDEVVGVRFSGGILSFKCGETNIVLPGDGTTWNEQIFVKVEDFATLPRRLMRESLTVAIWESQLTIGGHRFPGEVKPVDY